MAASTLHKAAIPISLNTHLQLVILSEHSAIATDSSRPLNQSVSLKHISPSCDTIWSLDYSELFSSTGL
jgi:hypothetical protein